MAPARAEPHAVSKRSGPHASGAKGGTTACRETAGCVASSRPAVRLQPPPRSPLTKHTILFLAANPIDTDRLTLDQDARAIQEERARSGHCGELVRCWAVRSLDRTTRSSAYPNTPK